MLDMFDSEFNFDQKPDPGNEIVKIRMCKIIKDKRKETYINRDDMIKYFQKCLKDNGQECTISPRDIIYMLLEHTV